VLANINKLNRSLEGVIAVSYDLSIGLMEGVERWPEGQVGNEFSSVEALWSQFENVMAKDPDAEAERQSNEGEGDDSREDDTEMTEDIGHGRR
jgi:DASH complex subunit DAD1